MSNDRSVLVVDDEPDLTDLLAYNLKREGYTALVAHNGRDGLALAAAHKPDLIVLDLMMPAPDGLEVARQIRNNPDLAHTPIIMLTAKSTELDELAGLTAGADDYITKPFSPRVLIARVGALLRRARANAEGDATNQIACGPIEIDPDTHEVFVEQVPVSLTVTEFRILAALVSEHNKVLSRASLITRAMGPGVTVTERTIDVHVTSIRRKMGAHAGMIKTVRGVGYRLIEPEPSLDKPSPSGPS
ncbi:MAG: DNA-binding response OmpR family regulator [Phycisphaerales bacterium]|jgi:DNA-binding response OmpR family regulator